MRLKTYVKIDTTEVTAHLHNSFHSKPTKNGADTFSRLVLEYCHKFPLVTEKRCVLSLKETFEIKNQIPNHGTGNERSFFIYARLTAFMVQKFSKTY